MKNRLSFLSSLVVLALSARPEAGGEALPRGADPIVPPSFERVGSALHVQGPADRRGFVLVGPRRPASERFPALEVSAQLRVPFLTDAEGRAQVALPALALLPGALTQVVFPGDRETGQAILGARELGAGDPSGDSLAIGVGGTSVTSAPTPRGGLRPGTDLPDATFLDENGDGIDGDASRAYFVDEVSGSPAGLGTRGSPLSSLQAAIDLAASDPARDHVYVSAGLYEGPITLMDGVSVWGGYDAADGWSRAADHVVNIHNIDAVNSPEGVIGVRGSFLTTPIVLADVAIEVWGGGYVDTGAGEHVFGLHLYQSTGLRLERVTVIGAFAGSGVDGAPVGYTSSSQKSGGAGGAGGNSGHVAGYNGSNGSGSTCGLGGLGALGGAPYFDGFNGVPGVPGLPGAWGSTAPSTVGVSGTFLSVSNPSTNGSDGCLGGGGGGGGGGGYAWPLGNGGSGGRGGKGGRAGAGAKAGSRGGTSVGVFLVSSHLTVTDCTIVATNGGWGGNASTPTFGNGSAGSAGQVIDGRPDGGNGGAGGAGGIGGYAGAGNGGNCYAVLSGPGSTATLTATSLTALLPGFTGASLMLGYGGEAVTFRQL